MVLERQESRLARNETRGGNLLLSGTIFKSTWLKNRSQEYAAKFSILNGIHVVYGFKEECTNLYDKSLLINRSILFC